MQTRLTNFFGRAPDSFRAPEAQCLVLSDGKCAADSLRAPEAQCVVLSDGESEPAPGQPEPMNEDSDGMEQDPGLEPGPLALAALLQDLPQGADSAVERVMKRVYEDIQGEIGQREAGGCALDHRRLSVGSACSGLGSEVFALRGLVDFQACFWAECEPSCRSLLRRLHDRHHDYNDICCDDFLRAPRVELFVAGIPCQPFSMAGQGRGALGPRGSLFFYVVRYIALRRPSMFVIENVAGLAGKHRDTLEAILRMLTLISDSSGAPLQPGRMFCFMGSLLTL
jgi:hypothetical protein